jgi:hypothetical protein
MFEVARILTARCGLADRLEIREANALALPFQNDTFDHVWSYAVTDEHCGQGGALAREVSWRCVLPPTERLRAAALLSVPHSPVEVISPFFVAPRERKQIELGIGEMAFILGDGQQLGRQLSVMISVQIGSRLICLL